MMTRWIVRVLCLIGLGLASWGCQHPVKRLNYERITSPAMQREMDYAIYLPPGWTADESLPLVVFLHGGGDDPGSFDRAGLGLRLDEAVQSGQMPRAVIVLPEGNLGMWANWYDGTHHYEDWVLNDLMAHIAKRYRTLPCPQDCHIMGISMGGFGSLKFVLHHPKRFASVAILSGPILSTDAMITFSKNRWWRFLLKTPRVFGPTDDRSRLEKEDPFLRWTKASDLGGMRLLIAWGDEDRPGIIKGNEKFVQHLRDQDIPHQSLVFKGPHKWVAWTPVVLRALQFQLLSPSDRSRSSS